jgi:hypothetical protein
VSALADGRHRTRLLVTALICSRWSQPCLLCDDSTVTNKRRGALLIGGLGALTLILLTVLLLRPLGTDSGSSASQGNAPTTNQREPSAVNDSSPESTQQSDAPSGQAGPAQSTQGESAQGPGMGTAGPTAASGGPVSPPPVPPPSPPSQPKPLPCTVSVYAGPMPGTPNIRLVVTAAPSVNVMWASVTENGRTLRGAIPLAGGRGEQVVEGVTQAARVAVFSDPSMSETTQSCSSEAR